MDAAEAGELVGNMWKQLGEQIMGAIPDIVISGEPVKAIHWATCAEACFWKSTGDADTHDVKDVVLFPSPQEIEGAEND
jgi:hypothetical protein